MKILEKLYSSDKPALSTCMRRIREPYWIKELCIAKPYGFSDQRKGVGTISSTSCIKTNIYALLNKHPRRKRSHGKRHCKKKPSTARVWYEHSCGPCSTAVYSHKHLNNLATGQKHLPEYTLSNFYRVERWQK